MNACPFVDRLVGAKRKSGARIPRLPNGWLALCVHLRSKNFSISRYIQSRRGSCVPSVGDDTTFATLAGRYTTIVGVALCLGHRVACHGSGRLASLQLADSVR